jgi:hypothetical protein
MRTQLAAFTLWLQTIFLWFIHLVDAKAPAFIEPGL